MNQRKTGSEKEQQSCDYLVRKGYEILARNYRCRYAEIDIVARDAGQLVFVEVKYRKNGACGGSRYAVSQKKIRNISLCARYYMYREQVPEDTPVRFDVIAIESGKLTHLKHAFEAVM